MKLSVLLLLGSAAWSAAAADDDDKDVEKENTYFNAKMVPPMLELTPENFKKELKASKFLMVKGFSPYCPHCIDYAPTFQTLYEFYYTSSPEGDDANKGFTKFYDFRFASLNCIAFYDLCSENGITSYPTTLIYKNGNATETFRGVKDMATLSEAVEKELKAVKPDSRPNKIALPTPGATAAPAASGAASSKADKSKTDKAKADKSKTDKSTTEKSSKKDTDAAAEKKKAVKEDDTDSGSKTEKTPVSAAASYVPPAFTPPIKKQPKASGATNPEGKSVPLTAETFQTRVTMTREPWFIKFYAPWCHHCQAMASNWQQLAKEMEGKLNIGEVNCDVESRLCKDARLRGYPTILFFQGGERVEYDGLRGLGDFKAYAEKAIDICKGVQDVDAASFKELEKKEEVIFVYFYDHATTSEDFNAIERLSLSLIGRAKLVRTQDRELFNRFKITTLPRLLVAREGRPTYYTPLTPDKMRDTHQLLHWMKSVWLPIVPELTASNAREIMDGKIVVLGILERADNDAFTSAKWEMKSAANEWMDKQIHLFQQERQDLRNAKQLRIEEAEDRGNSGALKAAKSIRINMDWSDKKEVTFAWVDGVFWQRWIKTTYGIDVKDGERVIINDEDNRRYWDQTMTGNPILPSRTSISETLNKVTVSPPKIKPKLTISSIEKIFFDIRITFSEHPYLTGGCLVVLALAGASWFRGRLRRTRGHFRLDDSKAPLLGVNANGKVD